MAHAETLFKAASIPPGATVRPNGPGTDGHPELIQPSAGAPAHAGMARWSTTTPGNKAFDITVTIGSDRHGRAVLAPAPTPQDIENGRVTHFVFRSWHPIDEHGYRRAREAAHLKGVAPTETKKAAPVGAASLTSRAHHGNHEPPPDTEGLAFDWSRCFPREHHRTPDGADGGTGPRPDHGYAAALLKASSIPAGARWITVRPNGPGTEGHPVPIQPSGDGAFHVIGGAGGKLNNLKLTGVRSEAE